LELQAVKLKAGAAQPPLTNHLGDREEFLPTKHGFDEFFGNLCHLNAEEEPESPKARTIRKIRPSAKCSRRAAC
jgi:arylsulfatase A-like enzyme